MKHNSSKFYARPWRYFLAFLVAVMVFNSGCAITGAAPASATVPAATATTAPSNTPKPTDTAVPTATPAPTDTPVPTATLTNTPTQDLTATAAVEATKNAESAAADFKAQLDKVGVKVDTGHLVWSNAGADPGEITMNTPGDHIYLPFAKDISVSDFILKTDVTWNATGILVCGMMLRSDADFKTGKHYQFEFLRISGLPAWDLTFIKDNTFIRSVTTSIKYSDVINLDNDATNTFIIVAEGDKFTFYANNKRLGSYFDYPKSSMEGYLAYTGYQQSGQSTCTYSNTTVWALK